MTTTYVEPDYVHENRQKRALASGRPQPCGEGTGGGLTCRAFPTRPYKDGWRCSTHEPQPVNPVPDPARTVAGLRAAQGDIGPKSSRANVTSLTAPAPTLTERFIEFHAKNPHVMERLEQLVAQHVAAGAKRLGIGALFEELRGQVETNGDRYALNNSLRADYTRALISAHPEWADLFELRQRRSA